MASLIHVAMALQVLAVEPGQTTLPRFQATGVRVVRDTAWFITFDAGEGVTSYPLVGYVPATRQWITTSRRWREIAPIESPHDRSGPAEAWAVRDKPLGSSHRLVLTAEPPANEYISYLVGPDSTRVPLRFPVSGSARLKIYRDAYGTWPDRRPPPRFEEAPALWARNGDTWAFAFDGEEVRDGEPYDDAPPPVMGGLLMVDWKTRRLTPALHPGLIAESWIGLEAVGGFVFAAPRTEEPVREDADLHLVRLARFDLARKRWRLYDASSLPTGAAHVHAIASDARHLYLAAGAGVAVLDVARDRWTTLFYVDTTLVLADGADSLVTRLGSTAIEPGSALVEGTADSIVTIATFVDELGPRHRRAFADSVARLIPLDTIRAIVEADSYDDRGHDIEVTDFNRGAESAARALGRREFRQFLREAMWKTRTQSFAAMALQRIGPDEVREALRSALDSGTVPAAIWAADTLMALGDSAGVRWLRTHMLRPGESVEAEGPPYARGMRSFGAHVLFVLARNGDTASIPAMLALVPESAEPDARARYAEIVYVLTRYESSDARRMIGRAIEERPWLWIDYLQIANYDQALAKDPDVQATVARIRARQR